MRRFHIGHVFTADGKAPFCFWVCKKANCNHSANDNRHQNNPEGRFLIVHHGLYTLLYSHLTKSKRTRRNYTAVDAASHKCLCIIGSLFIAHFPDNLFITCKFNIPAQQYIAEPHQRIEPMNCQQQKTEWLPPMILAADMRLLMGNHMIHLAAVHMIRKIDFGFDDSQHKRRANILALIDVAP